MDTRKIAVVASFAAVALALSGCSTGNAEEPTNSASTVEAAPSATSPKSVSPSASETDKYEPASANGPAKNVPVPNLPAAAKKNSEEGAAAFAEYYFDLVNYTIETRDPDLIRKVTTSDCTVCKESTIDPASRAEISGKWQVGGKYHPEVIDSYISGKNLAIVTVRYTADAAQYYLVPNEIDSELSELGASETALGLEFDKQWKIYSIAGVED